MLGGGRQSGRRTTEVLERRGQRKVGEGDGLEITKWWLREGTKSGTEGIGKG